ncbi:MAG TPA: hypothetical protein VNA15_02060 [Candidatus Angelobacter sp.]|nr:hypothetical protein [Candidatus Angelobacter sp.]
MSEVRQAHLPGNYEMYTPSSNKLGPVICKECWEGYKKETTGPLDTIWVSFKGERMVWWMCQNHAEKLKAKKSGDIQFLKLAQGTITNPRL